MVKNVAIVLSSLVMFGCDHFGGPSIRNEFPNEIKVSVSYGDGTKYSGTWPSCAAVNIAQTEVARFGVKPKDVTVDQIVVESGGSVVYRFSKKEIEDLQKRDKEAGHPIWVLNSEGIKFSYVSECALPNQSRP